MLVSQYGQNNLKLLAKIKRISCSRQRVGFKMHRNTSTQNSKPGNYQTTRTKFISTKYCSFMSLLFLSNSLLEVFALIALLFSQTNFELQFFALSCAPCNFD